MVKIEVLGTKQALLFLKNKENKIESNTEKGILKATLHLQNEVKESIAGRRPEPKSVDTGRFLNSVDISTTKDQGLIFSNISYAKYLEYGTSRIKARKHFNNSKDREKTNIAKIINNEVKNS